MEELDKKLTLLSIIRETYSRTEGFKELCDECSQLLKLKYGMKHASQKYAEQNKENIIGKIGTILRTPNINYNIDIYYGELSYNKKSVKLVLDPDSAKGTFGDLFEITSIIDEGDSKYTCKIIKHIH